MRSSNAVTYRGTLAIWSGGAGRRRSFLANAKCKRTVMHCTHSCHRHSFMANAKCKRNQCTAHAHALSAQPQTMQWVRERTAFHVTFSCCRHSLLAKTKCNKRSKACTCCHMPCTGGVHGWVWARRHTDGALDDVDTLDSSSTRLRIVQHTKQSARGAHQDTGKIWCFTACAPSRFGT